MRTNSRPKAAVSLATAVLATTFGFGLMTLSASAVTVAHSGPGGPVVDGHTCTVWGGAGSDHLVGSHPGDVVCGLGGNDHLLATANDVTLIGGPGNDRLVVQAGAGDGDVLLGDDGNDHLVGGAGNETLDGGNGNDALVAGTGNDVLTGDAGNDHLKGGPGHDVLIGGDGTDALAAGTGPSILSGGNGNDHLKGASAGNDTLIGGNGNDVINAEDGQGDTIDGGTGSDTIEGCGSGTQVSVDDSQGDNQDSQGDNQDGNCQGDDTQSVNLGEFSGTITNVTATSIAMSVCEVDDVTQAWLTTNNVSGTLCSTLNVTVTFDANTQIERDGGLPLQVGDQVDVVADTTTATLNAIDISAEAPGE